MLLIIISFRAIKKPQDFDTWSKNTLTHGHKLEVKSIRALLPFSILQIFVFSSYRKDGIISILFLHFNHNFRLWTSNFFRPKTKLLLIFTFIACPDEFGAEQIIHLGAVCTEQIMEGRVSPKHQFFRSNKRDLTNYTFVKFQVPSIYKYPRKYKDNSDAT